MLTVGELHEMLDGLDPQAPIVVGVINGPGYDPAYAEARVFRGVLSLYICCHEDPRPWEGEPPVPGGDGGMTLRYDPGEDGGRTPPADPTS